MDIKEEFHMDKYTENNVEFKGVPLDNIQKGDFTYEVSSSKYTLSDYAKEMREDLENSIERNENVEE